MTEPTTALALLLACVLAVHCENVASARPRRNQDARPGAMALRDETLENSR